MNLDERNSQLKARAEQLVNFSPQEISAITPEEIQRLFYDLQVYQIELQMQNEELQKAQLELSLTNNRLNFIYHSIPIGILTLDFQGFILQSNYAFAKMLNANANELIKKHFSKLILEEDKNIFIQRYDPFFKAPEGKSIKLRLQGDKKTIVPVLIKGNADDGSDEGFGKADLKMRRLIIAITDVSEIAKP